MTQPPADTAQRQAIRLERYSLALYSYSLALALLFVGHTLGFIHTAAAVAIALATIGANAVVYLMLVSGFNLRFADPSLTKLQVYLGVTLLMAALYYVDIGRGISLGLCFLIFLFGIFRMSTRELMLVVLYTLAAYALVINLLMRLRPDSIQNLQQEWFNWVSLGVSLPWFAIIGGRIREMRDRLRARKQELQEAIGTIQAMA